MLQRAIILILFGLNLVFAVDRKNFKTCDQSSFCKRCRSTVPKESDFVALPEDIQVDNSGVRGSLLNKNTQVKYYFYFQSLIDNTFRLRINEEKSFRKRFQPVHALVSEPVLLELKLQHQNSELLVITTKNAKVVLNFNPFKIDIYYGDTLVISANDLGRFVFEHQRAKPPNENGELKDDNTGEWEEYFKEHLDSKPLGPTAVAMDFSFPLASHAYGIPLHADSFALKSTNNGDPYRLYNLDVFEYEVNERMALYGAIPFVVAHGTNATVGMFWLNAAETWVDINNRNSKESNTVMESIVNFVSGSGTEKNVNSGVDAYFMSESGILDAFFLLGPGVYDVTKQYCRLTGTAPIPPLFSLAYHQSRWNYNDEQDVYNVVQNYDKYDIPLDVMWLDIEYTDGKKYFTWDPRRFPTPQTMLQNLTNLGRKLVVIIDPHIKRDTNYFVHNDATSRNLYVKNKDGNDYEGWCWPGSSSYLDFLNPETQEYYMSRYSLENFVGSTEDMYIWNDMNEPSVFNGPEVTMPKDCIHHENVEHREIHNMYGLLQVMHTYEALIKRSISTKRPFILSRSFFAGSQRFGGIWTGDNMAEWSHLKMSIPMCLSMAIAGISFCGADVGGFFKNPDAKLFTRWYQAGSYLPFFRGHSHIDTNRREIYLFDEDTIELVRNAIRDRYAMLPFWYTLFSEHEHTGAPVIRPLLAEFPMEEEVFDIDYEFLLGSSILVRPVTEPDVSQVGVYFPGENEFWYDKDTYEQISHRGILNVDTPISKNPVYYRGGSIIPRKERVRRSSPIMINDPYTLYVALDINGTAVGTLYIDDGESFEYTKGNRVYLQFTFVRNELSCSFKTNDRIASKSRLERVVVIGIPNSSMYRRAILTTAHGDKDLSVKQADKSNSATIRDPGVNISSEWTIRLV